MFLTLSMFWGDTSLNYSAERGSAKLGEPWLEPSSPSLSALPNPSGLSSHPDLCRSSVKILLLWQPGDLKESDTDPLTNGGT